MLTVEGFPRIARELDDRESENFSVDSSLASSIGPTSMNFGPVSPGWNVTTLAVASKSSLPAVPSRGVTLYKKKSNILKKATC